MASAICLDCKEVFVRAELFVNWNTSNELNHHIVIIAKGNIIEGIEARW